MRRRKLILLAFPVLQALMLGLQLLHPGSLGYAQLTGTVIPLAALGLIVTDITLRRKERERAERRIIPPVKQVRELGKQYGLPVVTALQKSEPLPLCTVPSVSGGTLGHVCNAGYYGDVKFCPVHGEQDAPEKEPEYVPEGQADLSAMLLEYMQDQVADARTTQWTAGRRREWRVSAEWLEEIRKLRTNGAGKLLREPRQRVAMKSVPGTVFGYPVVVADHFGVPELTAI